MHPLIEQHAEQLPVQRLCALAGVPRASFYRGRQKPAEPQPNDHVLQEIRRICEEMPSYGSPRVTAELRRRSYMVNHKRV